MPVVQPKKSAGQALAEGLGVAAKGLATIGQTKIEENNKRNNISQSAKGTLAGRTEAYRLIAEAKKNETSLEMLGETYAKGIGAANDALGGADNINPAYFSSYMGILGNTLANEQAGNEKLLLAKQTEQDETEMSALLSAQFDSGMDGATMYDTLQNSHLNMTNADFGKFYISKMAAIIKQKHQDDPTYDAQAAIDKTLKIVTKKGGVKFATHRTYGKTIDTLEKSIQTLNNARATAADKAETDRVNNWTNSSVYKLTVGEPTIADVQLINEELQTATTEGVATEKFAKVANALSVHLDRAGFGKNTEPEILSAFRQQATEGKLNQELLKYKKHKIKREDFLALLNTQSKYETDYVNEVKRQQIEGVNKARIAGKGLVAEINQFGMVMGDIKAKQRAFNYDQQYELYIQSYMDANNNDRPPGDVAFKKAQEIANGILATSKLDTPPEIKNYTIIAPYLQSNDVAGLRKLIDEGKVSAEEADAAVRFFKNKEK